MGCGSYALVGQPAMMAATCGTISFVPASTRRDIKLNGPPANTQTRKGRVVR